ncbi:hypothetical protein [Nocardia spumae]|uniref:hypothetical protein n=1 Tax=Nocardia spumae TaxID=2887190 RepID=UPI001D159719|nr:hypothetical protein [Nocardia spumae]
MPGYTPTTVDGLVTSVAEAVFDLPGAVVVAVDGADAAAPRDPAGRLAELIRTRGRPAAVVWLHDFVRPASVRLEFGRDEMSYRTAWFDYAALDREVLQALRHRGRWLPALWNEADDRSARAAVRPAGPGAVVVVAGPMLLGRNLDFDLTVRLQMSEPALRRRTDPGELWTIPALLRHDAEHDEIPAFEVRWDHPDRPALRTNR